MSTIAFAMNRREFCVRLAGVGALAGRVGRAGTRSPATPTPPAGYLFAHMTRKDYGRLYYALSRDGLHWRTVNGGRRVLPEYRGHPDLMRGHDGRFYLTGNRPHDGTIRFWVSKDLIHWTRWRDFVADMSAYPGYESPFPWHGAPKLFYDDATRTYLLTWHFSDARKLKEKPENYWSGMRTFYATSRDLVTFTKARRLFAFEWATIDVIVRREADRYYALLKDERYPSFTCPTGKTIRVASAKHLTGPWSPPSPPISPNFREAPTVIPRPDGRGWYLYSEQYPGLSYGLATAPHLGGPWHDVYAPNYHTPEGARHGCMVALSAAEYAALDAAFSGAA